jgi:putative GTP pyrophosphokinase
MISYNTSEKPLTADEKRSLAYTFAQSWGMDRMFEELFRQRRG